jgi:hypothetical protein
MNFPFPRLLLLSLAIVFSAVVGCERDTTTVEFGFLIVDVVDQAWLPVENAFVQIRYPNGTTASAGRTPSSGRYTDRLLFGQQIELSVSPPKGYVIGSGQPNPQTFVLSAATADVTVVLSKVVAS